MLRFGSIVVYLFLWLVHFNLEVLLYWYTIVINMDVLSTHRAPKDMLAGLELMVMRV